MDKPQSTIHCLFEEYEKLNGHYQSRLLAISTEKDLLRELMKTKVAADEYGIIAQKGVEYYDEDTFKTNSEYSFGYVKYIITDEKNLSRAELSQQIFAEQQKTKSTFEETIWNFPESKAIRLFLTECRDGLVSSASLLSFLTECKKEAGLTNNDLQIIKNDLFCKQALSRTLETYLNKDKETMDWKNVRSFYSDQRRKNLILVLGNAYKEYRTKNQEE